MKLTGFIFGIRTVKSFSVEDKLGAIIDEILYSNDSEINERLFTNVNEGHNARILWNPSKPQNRLTITPRDFIFDYEIEHSFDKEFRKYLESYMSIIVKRVFTTFKIKNISRFGFVLKTSLDKNDLLLEEVTKVIKGHKGMNDSFSLRFNVIEVKPIKVKNIITEDYDNEIVTYDKANKISPMIMTIDYQKYFKPELVDIKDATQKFDAFCFDRYNQFKKSYLNKNGKK